jgi:hypothetical protein
MARMIGRGRTTIALVIGPRERRLASVQVIGRRQIRLAFPVDRRKREVNCPNLDHPREREAGSQNAVVSDH